MLTSFFGKSSPSTRLILGIFITVGFLLAFLYKSSAFATPEYFFGQFAFLVVSVFSMLLLNFIIIKNHLTKQNSYAIFFFSGFMVMMPSIFYNYNIILSNIFILLAIRRIISFRTDVNSQKKILDASLWITIASFFSFSSILFFIPLWIGVSQKPNSDYKQMLIPLIGFFAAFIIMTAFQLLVNDSFGWFFEWNQPIGFDFAAYNRASIFVPASVIFGFLIWTGSSHLLKLPIVPLKEKPRYVMMLLILVTSIVVALASLEKSGAELLFILAPLSIICANYTESTKGEIYIKEDKAEFWFKEVLLWSIVILPFVFFLL